MTLAFLKTSASIQPPSMVRLHSCRLPGSASWIPFLGAEPFLVMIVAKHLLSRIGDIRDCFQQVFRITADSLVLILYF